MSAASAETHTAQERLVGVLRGPLGGMVARPWFDAAALKALSMWFFPLSRMWGAAMAADGSPDRFFEAVPMAPDGKLARKLTRKLAIFEDRKRQAAEADLAWREGFYGPADPGAERLAALEAARIGTSHVLNNQRRQFLAIKVGRKIPAIHWDIPEPEEARLMAEDLTLEDSVVFAAPSPMPEVERSRAIVLDGVRHYWLRFRSPDELMGDMVTARVLEPVDAADPPTLVYGHGICVEFDHWRGMLDEVAALVARGVRVVRPEAPWHGRRVPAGFYGGERMIATAPVGALHHFIAAIREWSVLIDWARANTSAPVAVGGTSLGSMTAQLVAHKARVWPDRLKPDAMLLITHCGQLAEAVREGAFARVWGTEARMAGAGWTAESIETYSRPLTMRAAPVMAGSGIVSVLGKKDKVTPYAGGRRYVERWQVPRENVFESNRGHFSVPVSLLRDIRPVTRFVDVLHRAG